MPFIDRLLERSRVAPAARAVVSSERSLTYGQLAEGAAALPMPAGAMIALDITDPIEFTIVFTAVIGRGRCAVVLDPSWPRVVRNRVLDGLRPDAVLTAAPHGIVGYTEPSDPLAGAPADTPFYCGFTSGTSGMPKAFVRNVGSWARSVSRSVSYFGVTPGLRVFAPGPLSSSLNLYALVESLTAGATFFTPGGPPDAARGALMGQMLAEERIEHLVGVPAALGLALQRADSLPDLRTVVSGGARLSRTQVSAIRRAAPAVRIFEYYGASELSLVTARRVGDGAGNDVGKPFPGVQIRVETVEEGTPGTIWVNTDTAIDGYLLGDDGRAFTRDGDWVTVHDQGWIDDDGALHLAGRTGDMLVVAGTNVYPSEVEAALATAGYPAAAVFGVPDRKRGTLLAAAIELEEGRALDAQRIRTALREVLPAAKIPQVLLPVRSIPLTRAGKPDRSALSALVRDQEDVREPVS